MSRITHTILTGDAAQIPLPDRSVDLVFGSPPYMQARTYSRIGIARKCREWVSWMLLCTAEAQRVSRGLVLWVVGGSVKNHCYQPGPEGLAWEWYLRGGECQLWRPTYWRRSGISGSGGKQGLRSDVEYVLGFKRPGPLPWAENTAMGHPPKWAPGGAISHRISDGTRVNQRGGHKRSSRTRKSDGTIEEPGQPSRRFQRAKDGEGRTFSAPGERGKNGEVQAYIPPKIANPGNLISIKVGGGHMGHPLAHENEAPFPQKLPEFFIRTWCPLGGLCLDPFGGSGSTAAAAQAWGRNSISMDLRECQGRLTQRRLETSVPLFDLMTEAR